jgi:enoyl-CoA hydratase/carnithine racemase
MNVACSLIANTIFPSSSKSSLWELNEANLGWIPSAGMSYHLSRMDNSMGNYFWKGLYLALTGNKVRGAELLQLGISGRHFKDAKQSF